MKSSDPKSTPCRGGARRRPLRGPLTLTLTLTLTIAAVAAAAAAPAARLGTPKAVEQSDRIARQIDALLGHRQRPEPLPAALPNPFAASKSGAGSMLPSSGATTSRAPADPDPAEPPGGNAAALARYVSTLKIGGAMRLGAQGIQVVINDVTRREGDLITARQDNFTLRIQVLHILQNELVLKLGDAELSVRF